jgi:hypothetical protein
MGLIVRLTPLPYFRSRFSSSVISGSLCDINTGPPDCIIGVTLHASSLSQISTTAASDFFPPSSRLSSIDTIVTKSKSKICKRVYYSIPVFLSFLCFFFLRFLVCALLSVRRDDSSGDSSFSPKSNENIVLPLEDLSNALVNNAMYFFKIDDQI